MNRSHILYTSTFAALLALAGIAGCDNHGLPSTDTSTLASRDTTPPAPQNTGSSNPTTSAPPATATNDTTGSTTQLANNNTAASNTGSSNSVSNAASNAADKVGATVDNATLTTKVKAALAADAGLSTLKLKVKSSDGAVTITGTVPSQQQKDAVQKVAESVHGVSKVQNEVTVGG